MTVRPVMHADELETTPGLVHRLLEEQFPRWARLHVEPIASAGTDNALFRLGDDKAVRLPRIPSAADQVTKQHEWLPRLAPLLPLAIPTPLAKGSPSELFPWQWSVYRWLEGTTADSDSLRDAAGSARELARFIEALHGIDPTGAPLPGAHNSFRGCPLARRDDATRTAIHALRDTLDADAATEAWCAALSCATHSSEPVLIHGDLQPANLLVEDGRLSAVIDFGCFGAGDPACDLMVAWTLLRADERPAFRSAVAVDDAAWARGRGWALSFGLIALPYYQATNPALAAIARRTIDEVLTEHTDEA